MNQPSFALTESQWEVVFVISVVTLCFFLFWFISESSQARHRFFQKFKEPKVHIYWVLFQKFTGVFFLGLVPLLLALLFLPYSLKELGLGFQNTWLSLAWIGGLAALIFPMNINAAKRPQNLAMYPMMRVQTWSGQVILLNTLATVSYLLAYEFLFRGILLSVCTYHLGVWPAIAINVALYAAFHLPKGAPETIGAIPFGILIGYITLTTGTIWVAVVVHIILSLSNDYLAVRYHPEMHYKL